jgi:hypothetical protein
VVAPAVAIIDPFDPKIFDVIESTVPRSWSLRIARGPSKVERKAALTALPEKKESEGIPLQARIGFKNRAEREASTEWASRIRRICVHG